MAGSQSAAVHADPHHAHQVTMRFGSTAKVLLKCKLKYYRISECRYAQVLNKVSTDTDLCNLLRSCCGKWQSLEQFLAPEEPAL